MSDDFNPIAKKPAPSVPQAFNGEIYQNVGKYARGAVLFAFEQMGGPEELTEWAKKNKDDFYTKLFPKIIARESEVTHHKTVDQLMDIIDGDYEVEGDFDEAPITVPNTTTIEPIAHNWNNGDYVYENDDILREAGVDLVDFEE